MGKLLPKYSMSIYSVIIVVKPLFMLMGGKFRRVQVIVREENPQRILKPLGITLLITTLLDVFLRIHVIFHFLECKICPGCALVEPGSRSLAVDLCAGEH